MVDKITEIGELWDKECALEINTFPFSVMRHTDFNILKWLFKKRKLKKDEIKLFFHDIFVWVFQFILSTFLIKLCEVCLFLSKRLHDITHQVKFCVWKFKKIHCWQNKAAPITWYMDLNDLVFTAVYTNKEILTFFNHLTL